MDALETTHKRPRKDAKYNVAEIEQILPFKSRFIKATMIPEHVLILKSQILPAMFNYWAEIEREPKDEEVRYGPR